MTGEELERVKELEQIIETLKELSVRTKGKDNYEWKRLPHGICAYVTPVNKNLFNQFIQITKEWPKFSGNIVYPVPHPTEMPAEAYHSRILWDNDEYGNNRRDLAKFLLQRFKKVLKELKKGAKSE